MKFNAAEITELITSNASESRTLDYKRDYYGGGDQDRHEFLKDVSAFANTIGGYLVVGVNERVSPFEITGIALSDLDVERGRMLSWLSTGLEPRLHTVEFDALEIEGKTVLVITVPPSNASPHRIKRDDRSWFFLRTGTQAEAMDMRQLRSSFLSSEDLYDRSRNFRSESISHIEGNRGFIRLLGKTKCIVHALPLSKDAIQLTTADEFPSYFNLETPNQSTNYSRRFGFDGVMYSFIHEQTTHEYVQLFRNGSVEIVKAFEPNSFTPLDSHFVTSWFCLATLSSIKHLRTFYNGDIAILLSLCGIEGMAFGNSYRVSGPFNQQILMLPESIINTSPTSQAEIREILKPSFHVLFQSAGFSGFWEN